MPAKNTLKTYVDGGYYHLYNRGVNKMNIFTDQRDYSVFLSYLKTYLLPKDAEKLQAIIGNPDIPLRERDKALRELKLNNFTDSVDLLAYCLMPNHYHFLVKQVNHRDLEFFTKSLMTRYSQYFNRKYKRVGPVYQGRYKAVLIETEEQLLYLTRYIHRNPLEFWDKKRTVLSNALTTQPSSYPVYLREIKQSWVKPEDILANFSISISGFNSYQSFVESSDSGVGEIERTVLSGKGLSF